MCNLNLTCQVWDGSCECRSGDSCIFKPIPVPFISQSDPSVLLTLFKIIQEQNEMIKQLADQTRRGLERITVLEKEVEAKDQLVSLDESLTAEGMVEILYGKNHVFDFSLNLITDVPCPAYKERAFSVMMQVVDLQGIKVTCEKTLNFKAELYNTENPPKLMKVCTSGDPIMRGTLEVESTGAVLFRKIILKEVSSHFKNGCFFLVVSCKDSDRIRPLVIENLVVKARKMNTEPSKKVKVSEEKV